MRKITTFLLIYWLFAACHYVHAKDYYPYFFDAQALHGGTGKIINPSTKTVTHKHFVLGIHRFDLSISYGLLPSSEIGLFFDLKEVSKEKFDFKKIHFHSKYQFIQQESKYLDFSVGWKKKHFYLTTAKFFPSLYRWGIIFGLQLPKEEKKIGVYPFITIFQAMKWSMFILDYNTNEQMNSSGRTACIGWRFLLSPRIKLDLFLVDLKKIKNINFNNFVFGLTISG